MTKITLEDFEKVDIRVGTIACCEKNDDGSLLLVLDTTLGLIKIEEYRLKYPERELDLIGKQVCFVANLEKPKLLLINDETLIISDTVVLSGSQVR